MDKKFQKKKDRERQVKKEILAKRMKKRSADKEKRKLENEERAARTKQKPIDRNEVRSMSRAKEAEIKKQLLHNMEILKALETEYKETAPIDPHTIKICENSSE